MTCSSMVNKATLFMPLDEFAVLRIAAEKTYDSSRLVDDVYLVIVFINRGNLFCKTWRVAGSRRAAMVVVRIWCPPIPQFAPVTMT